MMMVVYIDHDHFKYEIVVGNNRIDLTSFGIKENVVLTGDFEKDIEIINKISKKIEIEKDPDGLDSIGLPVISEENDVVPRIIVDESSNVYSTYMADILTKYRFCHGSTIVYGVDSMSNNCMHVNEVYMDDTIYSVQIFISKQNSFCISKSYFEVGKASTENICFKNMSLFKKCAVASESDDFTLSYTLKNNYSNCRLNADYFNKTHEIYMLYYTLILSRDLPVPFAMNGVKDMKKYISEKYEFESRLIDSGMSHRKRKHAERIISLYLNSIQWIVK